jgi:glucose/arabinose dehydrogenase
MQRILITLPVLFLLSLSFSCWGQVGYKNAFPYLTFDYIVEIQNSGTFSDDRLFIVNQSGYISVIENDSSISSTHQFLDISADVEFNAGQELGLLGLAFHPRYDENRFFYVFYSEIDTASGRYTSVLERFSVTDNDPNIADITSRQRIFRVVKNQSNSNHNGGKIAFGPDGYLYISIGDGGGAGDPFNNAQNINSYFGKILRIDVDIDGNNSLDENGLLPDGYYEIPSQNPLINSEGLDEIYSWGIRNMWKMSFDPPTGRLWGGDVGQGRFEEINLISPGNYGWDYYEGFQVYDNSNPEPENPIPPIYTYDHSEGDMSITGGYVYRGRLSAAEISDLYIFGDYISGRVWSMDYNATTGDTDVQFLFRTEGVNISTFGQDINGELYFAGYGRGGSIYKITDSISEESIGTKIRGVGLFENSIGPVNGSINTIVTKGLDTVYVGGLFNEVGTNVNANNIAMWTKDLGWQNLEDGVNGSVSSIVIDNDGQLFVGGSFSTADNYEAYNIASYDHSIGWNSLRSGTDGPVQSMVIANDKLIVGGSFVQADGIEVNNVSIWSENEWKPLIDSITGIAGTNNEIRSIASDKNGDIYVGGNFGAAGGIPANRIAKWNGNTWSPLGEGTSGFVQAILPFDNYIYAAGNFSIAGSKIVNRIARWNPDIEEWSSLGNGLSNNVNTLASDGTYLYVGGQFTNAYSTAIDVFLMNNIARWSEEKGWIPMGAGVELGIDNVVNTLVYNQQDIFIGGFFGSAGDVDAQNLATWRNDPPSLVIEIQDILVNEGFDSLFIDLTSAFVDRENDSIFIEVDINFDSIAEVFMDNQILNVIEKGYGLTDMIIQANDGNGGSTAINIQLKVNTIPQLNEGLDSLFLEKGFESYLIDLSNVFTDRDGDPLHFSVSLQDTEIINARISEESLIIEEAGIGETNVLVSATDGYGGIVSDDLYILVEAVLSLFNNSTYDISIYPNPADNYLRIKTNHDDITNLSISIISLTGKSISKITSIHDTIDLRMLQPGIYIVRIESSGLEESVTNFKLFIK